MAGHWCILRTGGSKTLRLADALAEAGYQVWTPREEYKARLPRRKAKETRHIPIMPTFVFAHARHLVDLARFAQTGLGTYREWCEDRQCEVVKRFPDFSLQRYNDRYPLIDDIELRPLRHAERRATPLEKVKTFNPGERIKLTEGGFAGMSGIVQTSDGKHTMVCFPNFAIPIKISTLLLLGELDMQAEMAA